MNNELLYSTRRLFTEYCHGKQYFIPAYQRGYKWEKHDLKRLLDDINEFDAHADESFFYCLQNITLVNSEDNTNFNVVDGQQRLTTLTIILSYLGEFDLIKNKLVYQVRAQTASFIEQYIYQPNRIDPSRPWEEFLEENKAEWDYQDIYYIYQAYQTVAEWFQHHPDDMEDMKLKILDKVQLIVNLVKNIDQQKLFENLNGKRVPLDGADLIRAIIITRVAKKEVGELNDIVKQNVLMNERRLRIGLALDTINLWWSETNRKEYFRHFIRKVSADTESNIVFNEEIYPINYLYKLYSILHGDNKLCMELFEKKALEDNFINTLFNLQRTIENWYNNKTLYHLILFTFLYSNSENEGTLTVKQIFHNWETKYQKDFTQDLKDRLANSQPFKSLIDNIASDEIISNENWYSNEDASNDIIPVSILLDIIGNLNSQVDIKLPATHFIVNKEDKEHIFPQTPIGDKVKDIKKQNKILAEYIKIANEELDKDQQIELIEGSKEDWDNQDWRDMRKNEINKKLENVIPINSLGNICLLHQSVNRGYGNDFYLEKRIDIMTKSQEGIFIRPHVFDAFNKLFLERESNDIDMQMMQKWHKDDIIKRRAHIVQTITNFLKHE